jgi:hypothetical protein
MFVLKDASRAGMGSRGVEMADSTYSLAYEEALRGVVQQQAVLTDIRGRAATMLGAASVSTSFLGGIALQQQRPTGWSWVAIGAFVAVGFLTIWILLPRRGWTFRMSARKLIKEYIESDNPAELPEMYRDLALHLENHFEVNQRRLEQLFLRLRIASAVLVGEIVLWLLVLAGS